ncbi:MAG: hypothetical protein V4726_07140 [Verrucomicrobiota bacterium]
MKEPTYFFKLDGQVLNPSTLPEFCRIPRMTRAEFGRALACKEGTTQWVPLSSLVPLAPPPPPRPLPAGCGVLVMAVPVIGVGAAILPTVGEGGAILYLLACVALLGLLALIAKAPKR